MRPFSANALLVAILLLVGPRVDAQEAQRVSIYALIGNPERFDGSVVVVQGYVRIGLEDMSICPTANPLSLKDCVWLVIDDGPFESDADGQRYFKREKQWKRFHRKVAMVWATFDKAETGHFGGWSGGLKKITSVSSRGVSLDF